MKHRRVKKVKPPRPPKPAKIARPKGSELRIIYKGLVTADPSQMSASLATAMLWIDNKLPYILQKQGGKLTAEQTKWYDTALKVRAHGMGTSFPEEKITAFRQAIKLYEKLFKSVDVKVPDVSVYLAKSDDSQDKLKNLEAKLMEKYATVFQTLEQSLQPKTIDGRVVTLKAGSIKDPLIIDPDTATIAFRRDQVKEMYRLWRREGLLALIIEVLDPLSKIGALELEKDLSGNLTGRRLLKPSVQLKQQDAMWQNFKSWCQTSAEAPKRLIRVPSVPVASGASATPKSPRVGGFAKREVVPGGFTVGTPYAKVTVALLDLQWHDATELTPLAATKGLAKAIKKVIRRGGTSKYDLWKVEQNGNKYRIVPNAAGTQVIDAYNQGAAAKAASQGVTP